MVVVKKKKKKMMMMIIIIIIAHVFSIMVAVVHKSRELDPPLSSTCVQDLFSHLNS